MKPSCNGWSLPSCSSPSTVMSSLPCAWTANIVHDFTGRPFIKIVQAPQWVVSQPMWVPVSRSTSRSMWTRRSRGSTSASCFSPLIESFTSIVGSPSLRSPRTAGPQPRDVLRLALPLHATVAALSLGALEGPAQSAGRQHTHEIFLVLHRAAQVGGGLGRLGGELGRPFDRRLVRRLALQRRLRLRRLDGREAHVGEADPSLIAGAVRAERELRGHGGRGEVADLALELQVR